nr:MAG TPA: RUBREDOXIN REDUCTASE, RUBREDOXIN 2 DEGRADATION, IRON-SULFUR PROTEIN, OXIDOREDUCTASE [Caudoviricetes sp.]
MQMRIRKWLSRQNKKEPRYFCLNCLQLFRTGKFSRFDLSIYDDVCPYCGAIGLTFKELAEEYKELVIMHFGDEK